MTSARPEPDLVRSELLDGGVLLVTWHRPDRLNAWTDALEDQYFDVLQEAERDPRVRAVVVTGAGRAFCAGADLSDLASAADRAAPDEPRPRPREYPATLTVPLVAAVNGPAVGLGMCHALYCDARVVAADAFFQTIFVRRGLVAEFGISWLLPRLVGQGRAADLLLSGRRVGAEEALAMGLASRVAPTEDVVAEAVAYARMLATECAPWSIAQMKRQMREDASRGFDEALAAADVLVRESLHRPELAEGCARSPNAGPPVSHR